MALNSVAGLLQSDATRHTSANRSLVAQPRYLLGLVVDGLGWVCTVVALRHLPVFAVQAVLGGSIALTAILARLLYRSALRPLDRTAIGCCLVGLTLVAGSAGADQPSRTTWIAYVVFSVAVVLLATATAVLWRGGRSWPLAVIAGLGFGGTSLAVRAVQVPVGEAFGMVGVLSQPACYLLVCMWVVGMLSYTRALSLGSVAQVTALFQVTEVVVPGLLGIVLLGDSVRPGWWLPMVAGLVLATVGVVVLAWSPAHQPRRPAEARDGLARGSVPSPSGLRDSSTQARPVICAPPEFGGGVPLEVPRIEDQGHLSVPASPRSVKECTRTDRWSS